ncbi:MAG TPA: hypothetical protein VK776_20460 [Bryobacteraceae bacterium]|nr:hypothetical protein [Bryobacteraceae bacterium]
MTLITVKLTTRELTLLTSLASDQLFRREFIDPKMPGYRSSPEDVSLGKKLVERLRLKADPGKKSTFPRRNGATA